MILTLSSQIKLKSTYYFEHRILYINIYIWDNQTLFWEVAVDEFPDVE